MTQVACKPKLRSVLRSSVHPCQVNWVAIGHAVVYYAQTAHAFSAGIKCRHCTCTVLESRTKACGKKENVLVLHFRCWISQKHIRLKLGLWLSDLDGVYLNLAHNITKSTMEREGCLSFLRFRLCSEVTQSGS